MSRPELAAQLSQTLRETHLPGLGERYVGKVRDVYRSMAGQQNRVVMVTTDRLSAFDRVLTTIPFKGEVLNRLAQFWFEKTAKIVPNHVLDIPDPNVMVARACQPFQVEVVVRDYLTGSLWRDYQEGRDPYGLALPPGLRKDQRFPAPILTPSTKAPKGEHDLPISEAEVVARGLASASEWAVIRDYALALFQAGRTLASEQNLILVDTKYEFGTDAGKIYVIDEIHTPDSSRFWKAAGYAEHFAQGLPQQMLDKENIRQWLITERGFSGHGEPPTIPDSVRLDLAETYLQAYRALTGSTFVLEPVDVESRVRTSLLGSGYISNC